MHNSEACFYSVLLPCPCFRRSRVKFFLFCNWTLQAIMEKKFCLLHIICCRRSGPCIPQFCLDTIPKVRILHSSEELICLRNDESCLNNFDNVVLNQSYQTFLNQGFDEANAVCTERALALVTENAELSNDPQFFEQLHIAKPKTGLHWTYLSLY